MPPKTGKKTKAEEALAFLDDLDNLDAPPADAPVSAQPPSARPSTDGAAAADEPTQAGAGDAEAESALAFLEAQINQKRAPLSVPSGSSLTPRTSSPGLSKPSVAAAVAAADKSAAPAAAAGAAPAPAPINTNVATTPATSSGWGMGSLWSTATSALQSAQRAAEQARSAADEQYRKVRTEGVAGVSRQLEGLHVGGVDINKLRKDAEERIGGIVQKAGTVDLQKLRQDLLTQANSTFTTIINTVAPPISEHETLELWLSHPMVGYDGVEGVVYRAWNTILEQTESGELVIVWSPPEEGLPTERTFNPVEGWEAGWKACNDQMEKLKARGAQKVRKAEPEDVPVTTIPVYLQVQPVLAPLAIPEPALLLKETATPTPPPAHFYFIASLHDPVHGLRFTTTSQPAPGDWLKVEYEKSDWVEERLVEILRNTTEVLAQDYVATRMGLKPGTTVERTEDKKEDEPPAAAAA